MTDNIVAADPQTYEPGEVYRSAIQCDELVSALDGADHPCQSWFRIDGECIAFSAHTAVVARRHAADYLDRALRELASAEAAARRVLDALRTSGHPDSAARARVDRIVEARSTLELVGR